VDGTKDQSYALWGLTQDALSRTIFPLGGLTKAQAREEARRFGLDVAAKGESFEICFVTDNNYERFLKDQVPGLAERVAGGSLLMNGEEVGTHRGYPFFTIGQRRGIGFAAGEPVFVTRIDARENRVELGPDAALYASGLHASKVNMIKYADCREPRRIQARIRYLDKGGAATATTLEDGRLEVRFDDPRRAITPGQSVVLYEEDDVVGGGIIDDAF
jgi:tRNA-specific 2-thiouridylase